MRKLQRELEKKVTIMANELGTTTDKVMEVESAMFGFLKHKMKGANRSTLDFPNVYFRYLGTFHAAKNKLKYLNK